MQNELEVIKTVKEPTSLEMGALTSKDLQTAQLRTLLTAEVQESAVFYYLWGLLSKYSLYLLGKVI